MVIKVISEDFTGHNPTLLADKQKIYFLGRQKLPL